MIRRFVTAVAITFTAIAAVVAAPPGAAQAAYFNHYASPSSSGPAANSTCVGLHGGAGVACFQPYGDKFWIRDNSFDGLHVEMHGWVNSDKFVCWTTRGPNYDWSVCDNFYSYIPENNTIRFQVRLYDGGTLRYKSGNKYATT